MSAILLVEDDDSLGETLKERLEKEGYQVQWTTTHQEAESLLSRELYDLVILDVGLPDGSGFSLAGRLKERSDAPFIFVTAMASAEYRLQGYELGAEEYIPKPFHLREFLLRVGHVLEKHSPLRKVAVGSRFIDFREMSVVGPDGSREHLARRDCQVLRLLVDASPRVVSREEILEEVWGMDKFPSNRTVDNAVLRLRTALGDATARFIRSVRGVGYQFLPRGEQDSG